MNAWAIVSIGFLIACGGLGLWVMLLKKTLRKVRGEMHLVKVENTGLKREILLMKERERMEGMSIEERADHIDDLLDAGSK